MKTVSQGRCLLIGLIAFSCSLHGCATTSVWEKGNKEFPVSERRGDVKSLSLASYQSRPQEMKKEWPNSEFDRYRLPDRGVYVSCLRYKLEPTDSLGQQPDPSIPIEGFLETFYIFTQEFPWLTEPFVDSSGLEGLTIRANVQESKQLEGRIFRRCDLDFENKEIHHKVRGSECKVVQQCNPLGTWEEVWTPQSGKHKFVLLYSTAEHRLDYRHPVGARVILSPIALAFDVVTFPVQALLWVIFVGSHRGRF